MDGRVRSLKVEFVYCAYVVVRACVRVDNADGSDVNIISFISILVCLALLYNPHPHLPLPLRHNPTRTHPSRCENRR